MFWAGRGPRGRRAVVALCLLLGASALVPGAAGSLAAQEPELLRVGPTLVRGGGKTVPGLRAVLEHRSSRLEAVGAFPRERTWSIRAEAPLAWRASRNPETLRADAGFGLEISLFRPAPPVLDADPAALHPDLLPRPWDRGFVILELRAGAEAPQEVDHADLLVGGTGMYLPPDDPRWWPAPEVRLDVAGVACAACDLEGPDDGVLHVRIDGELGWNVSLDRGWVAAPLKPIWLRFRTRGFHAVGMSDALAEERRRSGVGGGAELAYRIDRSDWLHEVHVGWTGGARPVRQERRRAWIAGVSVTP